MSAWISSFGPTAASYKRAYARDLDGARRFLRRFARYGLLLRDEEHPDGGLGFILQGERIEVGLTIGAVTLMSSKGELRVDLPTPLPETICSVSLQRPIGQVLGHDLLDGRDYPICRVIRNPDRTIIHARTMEVIYEMPWAHLLQV